MSVPDNDNMLPHMRFNAFALVLVRIPMPRKAIPIKSENMMPSMFSGAISVLSEIGPSTPAVIRQTIKPLKKGLMSNSIPKTAPANAA